MCKRSNSPGIAGIGLDGDRSTLYDTSRATPPGAAVTEALWENDDEDPD
jgi:hypothetical protein